MREEEEARERARAGRTARTAHRSRPAAATRRDGHLRGKRGGEEEVREWKWHGPHGSPRW